MGVVKVKKILEMEFQCWMDTEARCGCSEGKQFFGDGISVKDGY